VIYGSVTSALTWTLVAPKWRLHLYATLRYVKQRLQLEGTYEVCDSWSRLCADARIAWAPS